MDVYIHEDTGCQQDSECDAAYSGDTFVWCEVEAGNGTCHYQTYTEEPSCYGDWDCDDADPTSTDTCSTEGCTHVIRETIVITTPVEANITATFTAENRLTVVDESAWSRIGDLTITANNIAAPRHIYGVVFSSVNGAAAWSGIALAQNGAIVATTTAEPAPQGSSTSNVAISFNDLFIENGETITYQVWGKTTLSYFNSGLSADSFVTLALNGLRMNGIGEDVIVSQDNDIFFTYLRHSKPTVTRQSLSTTTLTNSTQDLYKLQISADLNGSVEIYSLAFAVEGHSANAQIANLRVRVGNYELAPNEYTIYNGAGIGDFKYGSLSVATGSQQTVIVRFTDPRIIVGSGIVITVSATVSGTQAGDSITIKPTSEFGFLSGHIDSVGRLTYPGGSAYVSAIVWRDGYSNDNNYVFGAYDISDLTQVQTLSR